MSGFSTVYLGIISFGESQEDYIAQANIGLNKYDNAKPGALRNARSVTLRTNITLNGWLAYCCRI